MNSFSFSPDLLIQILLFNIPLLAFVIYFGIKINKVLDLSIKALKIYLKEEGKDI